MKLPVICFGMKLFKAILSRHMHVLSFALRSTAERTDFEVPPALLETNHTAFLVGSETWDMDSLKFTGGGRSWFH